MSRDFARMIPAGLVRELDGHAKVTGTTRSDAIRIFPLTDEIVVKAAEIYASLKRRGQPTGDADILIGASALTHGFGVVTNNEAHFRRIEGLHVDSWLRP